MGIIRSGSDLCSISDMYCSSCFIDKNFRGIKMGEALKQLIEDYDRYIKSAEDYLKYLKEQRKAVVMVLNIVEKGDKK